MWVVRALYWVKDSGRSRVLTAQQVQQGPSSGPLLPCKRTAVRGRGFKLSAFYLQQRLFVCMFCVVHGSVVVMVLINYWHDSMEMLGHCCPV